MRISRSPAAVPTGRKSSPLGNVPPMLRSRSLLYTAVTRAQCIAILVGREDVLRDMVANNRQTMRYTGLCQRLKEKEL